MQRGIGAEREQGLMAAGLGRAAAALAPLRQMQACREGKGNKQ